MTFPTPCCTWVEPSGQGQASGTWGPLSPTPAHTHPAVPSCADSLGGTLRPRNHLGKSQGQSFMSLGPCVAPWPGTRSPAPTIIVVTEQEQEVNLIVLSP